MIEWLTQDVSIPLGALLLLTALPFNQVANLIDDKLKVSRSSGLAKKDGDES